MNNKSIRDYINLIENAHQGVEEGSTPLGSPAWQDGYRAGIKDTTNKKPVGSYAYCDGWKAAKKHLSDKQKQQGVAEEQLEETTPEAIKKVEQLYRK